MLRRSGARDVKLRSLATFEFLVESQAKGPAGFAFIEANPRLQVEHTVTEEVTGIDLVRAQLDIAGGRTLEELELVDSQFFSPRGMAMQVRVNAETMAPDGTVHPSGGVLKDGTRTNVPDQWPYLSVDRTNEHLMFLSPSSPEMSNNGSRDAIV